MHQEDPSEAQLERAALARPMVIDYVSPLPPVRSGIADYSVDLLDALAEARPRGFALRVVEVPGQEVEQGLAQRWAALRPSTGTSAKADFFPVYHMGNNTYHEAIFEMALERPGIVVLHDLFLHHLLQERTLAKANVPAYVEELSRDHGWVGGAVALPPRWSGYGQSALFALPAHRTLLQSQRGVLVHSEWAKRFLEEEGITTPVRVVPMVMPAPEITAKLEERARSLRAHWEIQESAFVLGSFGFQTPIKRTATAIRALAQPGLEEVELVVAGQEAKEVDLLQVAKDVGVKERVHLVGFLNNDDFSAAIRACDLSVNLRFPTAGETSASLLRVLALGRGAIVSDYAQFRDFATDVVVRLPLGSDPGDGAADSEEVLALAKELRSCVVDRSRVKEMGARARKLVLEQHDPVRAAIAFAEAVRESAAENPGHVPAPVEPPRPTTLTWGRLESVIEVGGAEGWSSGEQRRLEVELQNHSFARFLGADHGLGGVIIEVRLLEETEAGVVDRNHGNPWLGLRCDLEPGQSSTIGVSLRRPFGKTTLVVEPHVVGGRGFSQSMGAVYTRTFD